MYKRCCRPVHADTLQAAATTLALSSSLASVINCTPPRAPPSPSPRAVFHHRRSINTCAWRSSVQYVNGCLYLVHVVREGMCARCNLFVSVFVCVCVRVQYVCGEKIKWMNIAQHRLVMAHRARYTRRRIINMPQRQCSVQGHSVCNMITRCSLPTL